MTQPTKLILKIFALVAAVAWFSVLRGQASELFTGFHPANYGLIDSPERIKLQAQGQTYAPMELQVKFGKLQDQPLESKVGIAPATVQVGDEAGFWVIDEVEGETRRITATLRYAGKMTLMYVDNQIEVNQQDLEQAAQDFERNVYPHTREIFGPEASPGLDGDSRLTILHTPLASAGGYYSSADTEPLEVNRFSNQREMFVIGSNSYLPGEEDYQMILAHEFQHMIHANVQPNSPAWFNEGMSMLAQELNGYADDELALIYLADPDIGLIDWSQDASETGEHYGAAQLYLRYFYQQYGGVEMLRDLLRAGAGSHLETFVQLASKTRPDIHKFSDLISDWAVANLLDDARIGDGRYAYEGLPATVIPVGIQGTRLSGSVAQLGVDYLGVVDGPRLLEFDGEDAVALTGAQPVQGEWMWWSGRGDARLATLTRAFDLQDVEKATLQFSTWYEIERHFDYAYVSVSVDEGKTWQTLPGKTTSREDPQGVNLGNGLTGVSGRPKATPEQGRRGRWVQESMDLSPYAGQRILLRFWMINDPAYNAQGLLLDEIHIPEISYYDGGEAGEGGWQSQGFVHTPGAIPQEWSLRLITETDSGIEVHPVELDLHNRTHIALATGQRGVLVVIGASPLTDEPARYQVKSHRP